MLSNASDSSTIENESPNELVVDKKVLGTIDASEIPTGYGVVDLYKQTGEVLITNDVGDVLLFIDPDTRPFSTMELKEIKWDAGTFLPSMNDLPEEYKKALEQAKMPETFHITKSPEGTEIIYGIGQGTSENPLEITQKSTNTYKDVSLVHLAIAKHVSITGQPLTLLLNEVLFTYSSDGKGLISIEATVDFIPPRKFDLIDKDIKEDKDISYIEWSYYNYVLKNSLQDPVVWYRENYSGYPMNMAKGMYDRVQKRLDNKDL